MDTFISGRNVAVWIFCGALILCACSCARKKKEPAGVQERAETGSVTVEEDMRPAIVALGDSLTAGQGVDPDSNYPSLLQRKIDKEGLAYKVLNYGVSGDTSGQGLNRLDSIINLKPAIVIVELGANDGLRGIPAEVTKQNLAAIIETASGCARYGCSGGDARAPELWAAIYSCFPRYLSGSCEKIPHAADPVFSGRRRRERRTEPGRRDSSDSGGLQNRRREYLESAKTPALADLSARDRAGGE